MKLLLTNQFDGNTIFCGGRGGEGTCHPSSSPAALVSKTAVVVFWLCDLCIYISRRKMLKRTCLFIIGELVISDRLTYYIPNCVNHVERLKFFLFVYYYTIIYYSRLCGQLWRTSLVRCLLNDENKSKTQDRVLVYVKYKCVENRINVDCT